MESMSKYLKAKEEASNREDRARYPGGGLRAMGAGPPEYVGEDTDDVGEIPLDSAPESQEVSSAGPVVREFETGANRDTDTGKLKFEGFLSPRVLTIFAHYMHMHRKLADGSLRDPDNWQKGIPEDVYWDSLVRHVMDAWLHHRGDGHLAAEENTDALLCAIVFNAMGLLFERSRDGTVPSFVRRQEDEKND